jgi:hypothetical protein
MRSSDMRYLVGVSAICMTLCGAAAIAQQNQFPLAAPAGVDSKARETAPPGAVNQGPYDMNTWKYGPAFNPPAGTKIWNPVKIKMMQGGKVTGGTVRGAADPTTYCAMANAGYDFIWTEMQHAPTTWDNAVKAWTSCPHAKAVPGARIAYTDEKEIQQALDGGALVLVVPTVDTVAEAIQARDWAFFPPLGKRSLGGGAAFAPEMWGNVPGGYRNTINDNLVLVLMIETLERPQECGRDCQGPGRVRNLCGQQRPRQLLWLPAGQSRLRARDQHRARRRHQGPRQALRPAGLEGPAGLHLLPGWQRDCANRPRCPRRARRPLQHPGKA